MIKISSEYLDMRKIADSGQVFRFNKTDDGSYDLIANNKHLRIQKLIEQNRERLF